MHQGCYSEYIVEYSECQERSALRDKSRYLMRWLTQVEEEIGEILGEDELLGGMGMEILVEGPAGGTAMDEGDTVSLSFSLISGGVEPMEEAGTPPPPPPAAAATAASTPAEDGERGETAVVTVVDEGRVRGAWGDRQVQEVTEVGVVGQGHGGMRVTCEREEGFVAPMEVLRQVIRDAAGTPPPPPPQLPTPVRYFEREDVRRLRELEVSAEGIGEERFQQRDFYVRSVVGTEDAVERGQNERLQMVEGVLRGVDEAKSRGEVLEVLEREVWRRMKEFQRVWFAEIVKGLRRKREQGIIRAGNSGFNRIRRGHELLLGRYTTQLMRNLEMLGREQVITVEHVAGVLTWGVRLFVLPQRF